MTYTATDVLTAFGEAFQTRRRIVLSEHQSLVSWVPSRPLRLLSLLPPTTPTGTPWALRNGASASLDSAPKSTCRAWARSIAETWPDLDGIHVRSPVTGQPMVTLFAPAATTYPVDPAYSRRLDDSAVAAIAVHVAIALNWTPPVRG
ncbi:RES domain-containing protein [Occultella glacieicola]|uniref:RES domain-containing protein n=1 Tax=Occultella glacieicola TaxID=2518684 RepID=UPI001A9F2178|nr:RES domain-containing protein [Occultella glacieicola]